MDIKIVGQMNSSDRNTYAPNESVQPQEVKKDIAATNPQITKLDNEQLDNKQLDKALKKINKFLEDEAVHAEYSVHEDFGDILIKIVDDKTKEVILEVPPKKILDMIASMCKQFGLLDEKA